MSDVIDCLLHTLQGHPELDGPRHGRVLFLGARPHGWFQPMLDRLTCIQRYKPLADALAAEGMPISKTPEGEYDLVIVIPDRQRQRLYADLGRAYDLLSPGGSMVAVVPNDWGAKRAEEALGKAVGGVKSLSKKQSPRWGGLGQCSCSAHSQLGKLDAGVLFFEEGFRNNGPFDFDLCPKIGS